MLLVGLEIMVCLEDGFMLVQYISMIFQMPEELNAVPKAHDKKVLWSLGFRCPPRDIV